MRVILIVLDSVGIGEAPDAVDYSDVGSATLQHIAEHVGLKLPTLSAMGLGNSPALAPNTRDIQGLPPVANPSASYGIMQEKSIGKDTVTGHWEIAGLELNPGFHLFPNTCPSFPEDITGPLASESGYKLIGNKHGSGTAIIEELGAQAMEEKALIVYTSADSVLQIAAHTDVIPIEEQYRICEIARKLCDPYRVGRVIARPFVGTPGNFERTHERKDFVFESDEKTVMERLVDQGIDVYCVGKIDDILAHRGVSKTNHTGDNLSSQQAVVDFTEELEHGLIFANFIDFDMLYGHRRDPEGYAQCLEQTDAWLAAYIKQLRDDDLLIITADHGNDPTFSGTDHTREYVPVLMYGPQHKAQSLGLRDGFYDIAQTVADVLNIEPCTRGKSFFKAQ